jgi:hypothetical protein
VPHDLSDSLSRLVDAERSAWKKVTAGAAWQRLKRRLNIAGHIIAMEFTWGDKHGWHAHYHVLLLHERDLDAAAVAAVHWHIQSRLEASCRDFGLRQPDPLHGVRIDPNVSGTAAGGYLAKGGDWTQAEEMTRGDLKTGRASGRTPFQILGDYYQSNLAPSPISVTFAPQAVDPLPFFPATCSQRLADGAWSSSMLLHSPGCRQRRP